MDANDIERALAVPRSGNIAVCLVGELAMDYYNVSREVHVSLCPNNSRNAKLIPHQDHGAMCASTGSAPGGAPLPLLATVVEACTATKLEHLHSTSTMRFAIRI